MVQNNEYCCAPEHDDILPRITFGIHPKVVPLKGRSVILISETFTFCHQHWPSHRDECFRIIKEVCGENLGQLSHTSELDMNLGCWVTLAGLDGGNFQLPYEAYEKIVQQFRPTVRHVNLL